MSALQAVQLPDIGTLTQNQQRGVDCVWCGITLSAKTAVDLGPRRLRIADWTTSWFPRACKRHPEGGEA
ncbi:hypothetical protein [Streptomyces sp. NPDC096153]|uniref:hypothetical protein n=1 Tax=Streptomyces sp. NPDC096153 TaxID=3155548 RepID=UPI003332D045